MNFKMVYTIKRASRKMSREILCLEVFVLAWISLNKVFIPMWKGVVNELIKCRDLILCFQATIYYEVKENKP